MGILQDLSRCRVIHPDGIIVNGRFIFSGTTAAVWIEDRRARTADRILFAPSATFEPGRRARDGSKVVTSDNQEWTLFCAGGDCGCGNRPLNGLTYDQLVDPDVSHIDR